MDNLSRIKIKGFKSIKELDLEIKPINVLIGANGSGKSNFISVFRLLENIYNQRLQVYINNSAESFLHFGSQVTEEIIVELILAESDSYANRYYVRLNKKYEDDSLLLAYDDASFHNKQYPKPYDEKITSNSLESNIKNSSSKIINASKKYLNQCKLYHFHDTSEKARFKSYQDIELNKFLDSFASNLAPFLFRLKQEFNDDYQNIVQAVQTVAPYFQDFDFSVKNEKIILRWQHTNDLSNLGFSAQTLSDGTARFICMATLFLQPKDMRPATIVLDEPEIGLHPAALVVLSEIIRTVANDGSQVIISTQSVTLANCFKPDDFIVVDYADGVSNFRRLDDKDQLDLWLKDYQMGDIWNKNLLGGRPW